MQKKLWILRITIFEANTKEEIRSRTFSFYGKYLALKIFNQTCRVLGMYDTHGNLK